MKELYKNDKFAFSLSVVSVAMWGLVLLTGLIEVYADESEGVRTLGRVSLYLAAGLTGVFVLYVFAKTRRS
jgi:hypothetical protein